MLCTDVVSYWFNSDAHVLMRHRTTTQPNEVGAFELARNVELLCVFLCNVLCLLWFHLGMAFEGFFLVVCSYHHITGHASRCWKRNDVSVCCLAWEVYCCSWAKYSIPWFGMLPEHQCSVCYLLHFPVSLMQLMSKACEVGACNCMNLKSWSGCFMSGCMMYGLLWCRRIWHGCWWFQTFRTLSKGIKRRSSLHWRIQTSG